MVVVVVVVVVVMMITYLGIMFLRDSPLWDPEIATKTMLSLV